MWLSYNAIPAGFAILERSLMRKIFAGIVFTALAGAVALAAPPQDRDERRDRDDRHDNGKHKGWDKHGDEEGDRHDNGKHKGWDKHGDEEGDRHDNGKHKGWDNPHNPHANWDSEHDRVRPGHAYPYGRYEHVRGDFIARRMDFRTRRVVLYDNSNWVVASYDLDRCRDWEWERDRVYVYDDDHHPGWYLLFNARLGRYVHVEYFGVH
jgi:hypothetical protein